jgi:transposase
VPGRKRHIVVDCLGLLLAVMVTAASVTHRDAARSLLAHVRDRYFRLKLIWADGGYSVHLVDIAAKLWRIALTVVKRSDDVSGFVVLPRRGVVERTSRSLPRCGQAVEPGRCMAAWPVGTGRDAEQGSCPPVRHVPSL